MHSYDCKNHTRDTNLSDFPGLHSRVVRKSIARVLTVINQTQKENLRKFYKVRAACQQSEAFLLHHTDMCLLGTQVLWSEMITLVS